MITYSKKIVKVFLNTLYIHDTWYHISLYSIYNGQLVYISIILYGDLNLIVYSISIYTMMLYC